MKQPAFIKSSKDSMHRSADIFILPTNINLITKRTLIVDQAMVSSSKTDRSSKRIKTFSKMYLISKNMVPKLRLKSCYKSTQENTTQIMNNFKDLLSFAEYNAEHDDIDFSSYSLFLYLDNSDNELYIEEASELFIGKAYGNDIGKLLADIYEKTVFGMVIPNITRKRNCNHSLHL